MFYDTLFKSIEVKAARLSGRKWRDIRFVIEETFKDGAYYIGLSHNGKIHCSFGTLPRFSIGVYFEHVF